MSSQTPPPVIAPLVRRHVEDAAFYWAQHDASTYSPRLSLSGLARFSDLLDAHLEGVLVADSTGWQPTLGALERWKQPGEAFVCAYAALYRDEMAQLEALLAVVRARPDELLRGVISALAWVPQASALAVISRWTQDDSDSVMQVAALRALALIEARRTEAENATEGGMEDAAPVQTALSQPLSHFLASTDAHVRAAACRVAANTPSDQQLELALSNCLQDADLAVRAQAAIAVALHARRAEFNAANNRTEQSEDIGILAAETLWQCIVSQVSLVAESSGWYRKQALRRLNRWVQHLAGMIPLGNPQLSALLTFMPARVGLRFVAYHGDPAHLPYVLTHMTDVETARYAGWVWQTVTGVDLVSAGLALAESEQAASPAISDARLDADLGLALPNAAAVAAYANTTLHSGQRYLLGQVLTPTSALAYLDESTQAIRNIAANYLQLSHPNLSVTVRGPAHQQVAALEQLQAVLQKDLINVEDAA
ncbi:hypothetical protein [Undibacterium sp. Xuan67W]|uniref:hypothetical protein n=1 Tax=Undibacterium sp. Xuan67W TaxID=3413057 RepID=UPI003BF0C41C